MIGAQKTQHHGQIDKSNLFRNSKFLNITDIRLAILK